MTETQSARVVAAAISAAAGSGGATPLVPHVAAYLSRFTQGDPVGIAEIARTLTGSQLRGESRIPHALLVTPSVRQAVAEHVDALTGAQRRLVLFAALSVADHADALLAASGVDIGRLLDWQNPELTIRAGRYSLRDRRVAAVVVNETSPLDIKSAHRALSKAFLAEGASHYAAWHQLLGSRPGDPVPARTLLEFSNDCLRAGNAHAAQSIAEAVARQDVGSIGARAELAVASAALWSGHIVDAQHAAERAIRAGDGPVSDGARSILALVENVRSWPSDPSELLGRVVAQKTIFGEAAVSRADLSLFHTFREADLLWYSAPEEVDAEWARYVVTRPPSSQEWPWDSRAIALTPLAEAFECLVVVTVQAQGVDVDGARRTLESGLARLPLMASFFGTVSSYVRELLEPAPAEVIAGAFEATASVSPVARYFDETVVIGSRSAAALQRMDESSSPEPQLRTLSELTARERGVVELAKTGQSDAAISTQLGISKRTVETHLRRVYRKLGVRSRGELVALVLTPVSRRESEAIKD